MNDETDRLVDSWQGPGLSHHAALEVAAVVRRGDALEEGEAVPGCGCTSCTGVSEQDPARPDRTRNRPDLPVERARRASILTLARRLTLGEPKKRGREHVVRCPFHEDTDPSLRLNDADGLWFCFPCGEGGDGIDLVERVRGVSFADAVKWIVRNRGTAR